jgi:hypothetical protein
VRLRFDSLTDGWQVFLYSVQVDEQGAWAGLAVFDRQVQRMTVELVNPECVGETFVLTVPTACQNSQQPLVKIRCQLKISRLTPVLLSKPSLPI